MSELDEIRDWLNSSREFDRGLMLHLAYVNNAAEYDLLKRRVDSAKLFTIMRDRFYALKENAGTPAATKAVPVVKSGQEHVLPKEMLDSWAHQKTEQERWHTELTILIESEEVQTEANRKKCAALAELIYKRTAHLDTFGLALNYYKANGKLPDGFAMEIKPPKKKRVKSIAKLTEADKILKLKNSIAPNISKLKSKIAKARAGDGNAKKIGDWEQQLTELEAQKNQILNAQQ